EAALREILQNQGKMPDAGRARDQDDLYALGLSSLATVNVMVALESRFDIEIPDEALTRDTFRTVASLAALVRELGGKVEA
ncbi:MAG TPA: acyl carrier protein, partial [Stellaceae bacterium]|nr:acyl carrier protein [Stellaceae bacterium]